MRHTPQTVGEPKPEPPTTASWLSWHGAGGVLNVSVHRVYVFGGYHIERLQRNVPKGKLLTIRRMLNSSGATSWKFLDFRQFWAWTRLKRHPSVDSPFWAPKQFVKV